MRKTRFLAGLLALLLLLTLSVSCKREPEDPGQTPTPEPGADNGAVTDDNANNTDPDADPGNDPDTFLQNNGYPMTFAVRFTKDGYGFDTASNMLLNGSESVSYTFTEADYRDLYRCLNESNFWTLPLSMGYSDLSGESAPNGPGAQYEVSVTTVDGTRSCRIDGAAIEYYLDSDPSVSNMNSIVTYLYSCVEMYHASAT